MLKSVLLFTTLWAAQAIADENLALHRKATIHTQPNYSLSTDANDALQLTDGKYAPGMWTSKESVTWVAKGCVVVTIDLEKTENIGEVRFSTAGRRAAGVLWPSELCVFLSEDGKTWSYAGDIVEQAKEAGTLPAELPPDNAQVAHVFKSRPILAPARFIGIVGRADGKIFTCDEIQVFAAETTAEPANPLPVAQGVEGMEALFQEYLVIKGVQSRIAEDRRLLKEQIEKSSLDDAQKQSLRERLEKISTTTYAYGQWNPATFRTVFPLNDEHRQLFEIQAELWRMAGADQPQITSFGRYDWLPHFHSWPTGKANLEIKLLRKEKRSAMLLVSNPRPEPVTFRVHAQLPEAAQTRYSFLMSPWTDTHEKIAVADALLPLGAGNEFTVPAGMTTKLWISFDSHGADAGIHEGAVVLDAPGFQETIPLKITVSPVALKPTPLAIGGWDYLLSAPLYGITAKNYESVMMFLKAHGINVAWLASGALPSPGDMSDTKALERNFSSLANRILKAWPEADYYTFFMNVGTSFAGAEMGSDSFNVKVAEYVRVMEKAFEQAGIAPEKLLLLTVDEPYTEERAERSAAWAKAIASARGRIRTFTDPTWSAEKFSPREYMELADIVSPNIQLTLADGDKAKAYFEELGKRPGKALWFYICSGPTRVADPVAYYRLASWFAFLNGGNGLGFWSFGDTGGAKSSWNEYISGSVSYVPFFLGVDGVDTSIHWEAMMEGRLDYSLFHMLKEAEQTDNGQITQLLKDIAKQPKRIPKVVGGDRFSDGYWQENISNQTVDDLRLRAIVLLEESDNNASPSGKDGWNFLQKVKEFFQ